MKKTDWQAKHKQTNPFESVNETERKRKQWLCSIKVIKNIHEAINFRFIMFWMSFQAYGAYEQKEVLPHSARIAGMFKTN